MDDKDLEEQEKQQEAGQKTAHVAGKAASTYFGGAAGGKIYDAASQTAVGKRIEETAGKALQQNPVMNKATRALNDSGALDAADKGLDLVNGGGQGLQGAKGIDGLSDIPIAKNDTEDQNKKNDDQSSNSSFFGSNDTENSDNENEQKEFFGNGSGPSNKKKKLIIISSISAALLIFLILFIVISVVYLPFYNINKFVQGIWNGVVDFFTTDNQELEEEYYQELKDVQQEFNRKYNVCIDINLITAALTVNRTFDDVLEDGLIEDTDGEDVENDDGSITTVPYKKMIKQIRLLANMQIMTKNYELSKVDGNYCANATQTLLITEGNKDSSSFELIASHDIGGVQAFFTSKVNEEQNNAYYIYKPPFQVTNVTDNSGAVTTKKTCSDSYAKSMLPSSKKELSIGSYDNKDSVFYWNLINSFIPEYYKDSLPEYELDRKAAIQKIANDIYLLYDAVGPSQTCTVSYAGPSSLCPNGITIEGVGTLELEDYIAGVVSREAYTSEGMEALKAQAVAARTYALKRTNYCQDTITNSTNDQTFTRDVNDRAREATLATQGEILVDRDGNIFESNYDSYCYEDSDCPDSVRNSDGTYSVTYTKVPYGEKHTITLSDSSQFGRITYGQGHALGMSQLLSYQLAKEGNSYREILAYFYSDGVEISLVLSPTVTEGAEIIRGPITNYLAVDQFNQNIYEQVIKSGLSTREGVVAAANTLVSGIYSQTGYKLPYELTPSGKYTGYGIDPDWGTNTDDINYPRNGLDCSGFISWAIHNGGYQYEVKNAQSWGNTGTKRLWSKGMIDDRAQPGDLIYNAPPASGNGTSGHIRMIIGITDEGYVVAEASSGKNGVRIVNVPFKSTGSYYLVDMSSYYETATKVTDYPM